MVFTGSNTKTAGPRRSRPPLSAYADKNPRAVRLSRSLGSLRYLDLMRLPDAVNRQLVDAASSRRRIPEKPAINIGDRQKGRLRARSIHRLVLPIRSHRGRHRQSNRPRIPGKSASRLSRSTAPAMRAHQGGVLARVPAGGPRPQVVRGLAGHARRPNRDDRRRAHHRGGRRQP